MEITKGPDLPLATAAHCQLNIGNSSILIYGGIKDKNNTTPATMWTLIIHHNLAWIWNDIDRNWTEIKAKSPCPESRQPPYIMQQCTMRNTEEIIILTQNFNDMSTCTSILNVKTFEWTMITSSRSNELPLGGFILTGNNPSKIFYLGGYHNNEQSNNRTIHELDNNEWRLNMYKLPFAMTGFDSKFWPEQVNMTKCTSDTSIWPHF